MSRNIRSERHDLHNRDWQDTAERYNAMLAMGLNQTQAVSLLAAKGGVKRTTIFNRLRVLGALPPYKKRESYHVRVLHTDLTAEQIMARRVDRDPCPRCGARGDANCGHRRAHNLSVSFA